MGRLGDTLKRLTVAARRSSSDAAPAPAWDDGSVAWTRSSGDRKAARKAERRAAAGDAWPTDATAYALGEVLGRGATAVVSMWW